MLALGIWRPFRLALAWSGDPQWGGGIKLGFLKWAGNKLTFKAEYREKQR
jgi:hypothetical protein